MIVRWSIDTISSQLLLLRHSNKCMRLRWLPHQSMVEDDGSLLSFPTGINDRTCNGKRRWYLINDNCWLRSHWAVSFSLQLSLPSAHHDSTAFSSILLCSKSLRIQIPVNTRQYLNDYDRLEGESSLQNVNEHWPIDIECHEVDRKKKKKRCGTRSICHNWGLRFFRLAIECRR